MMKSKASSVLDIKVLSTLLVLLTFTIPPLLWAGNYIVGRAVRDDIPPATLSLSRWSIALLIILPFAYSAMRRDFRQYLCYPLRIIAVSLAGLAGFSMLVYAGLHHTTGTNALLLNSCVPIMIMLFSALFYKVRLSLPQTTGLLISCIGVIIIIFKGDQREILNMAFSSGDPMLLCAMACFAFYTLWLKKIPQSINRIGLLGVQIIITLITVLPFWIWEQHFGPSINWRPSTVQAVLFLGIFPSFFSYLLYGRCIELLGAARAGLSIHLIPVFGVVLSVLFLGEKFHFFHLAGITTILTGVYLANYPILRK